MGEGNLDHSIRPYSGLEEEKHMRIQPARSDARLLGAIRALAGPEQFDMNGREDKSGIFDNTERQYKKRLNQFFPWLLDAALSVERGLFGKQLRNQANEETQAAFSGLTTMLARILYNAEDSLDRVETQGLIQRYRLSNKTNLYCPDVPGDHKKELFIGREFSVKASMETVVSVFDTQTNETLEIRLFPLDYAFYSKFPELEGASPLEAQHAIETKPVGATGLQKTHVALERGKKTYVPAHIEVALLNSSGCEVGQMRIEEKNKNGYVAFCPDYPKLEVPFKTPKRKTPGETYLTGLVKPLGTLQLRNGVKNGQK